MINTAEDGYVSESDRLHHSQLTLGMSPFVTLQNTALALLARDINNESTAEPTNVKHYLVSRTTFRIRYCKVLRGSSGGSCIRLSSSEEDWIMARSESR